MRVFKFWNIAETTVLIDGVEKCISCFGGSNYSESDALNDGYQRLEAVKRRIAGTEKGKGPDYQADIREEPLLWIEDRDVITRNRYGAEVLNSTSCIFVDIDEPVFHIWKRREVDHRRESPGPKIKGVQETLAQFPCGSPLFNTLQKAELLPCEAHPQASQDQNETDSPFLSLRGEGKESDRGMDQGIRFQEPRILHVPTRSNNGKPFRIACCPISR